MIPDFQSVMLPLLQVAADGKTRTIRECREQLATHFALSGEELAEVLPSGRTPRFSSRVHWAKTYLEKAGVLTSPTRGTIQITDRGRALLAEQVSELSTALLASRFEEMRTWRESSRIAGSPKRGRFVEEKETSLELPPDEAIEESFRRYREAVQSEILGRIKTMPPAFFERLVVDLLLRLGYGGPFGKGLTQGGSGDRGIDGVIHQDKLGLDLLYVQAKRWEGSVGGSVVREFAGALSAHRARKGVIITTSSFTKDAVSDGERMGERIVLIDGPKLAELLYETGLGLVTEATFAMKRIDSDYFEGA
jgi:restriction system protein